MASGLPLFGTEDAVSNRLSTLSGLPSWSEGFNIHWRALVGGFACFADFLATILSGDEQHMIPVVWSDLHRR